MRLLVTGAGGMIGRKLVERLVRDGAIGGRPIQHLTLADLVVPSPPVSTIKIEPLASDIAAPGEAERLIGARPDVIFHLAAIISGDAEANFEKGYRVNLDGMRALLEAIRKTGDGYHPKMIYTSSSGVFGAPYPEQIPDDFHLTPLTSYGTQKAIGELLLADYVRKGFLDGVGIRFPSICIRPGKPNASAGGFFSGIIREPLAGHEAILPVPDDVGLTHASPRSAVGFLIHAATLKPEQIGARVNLTMPGVFCTVGEQIEALRKLAGDKAVALIRREPNELILRINKGWPGRFDARRAQALGFRAETSFEEIVRVYIEDELGGRLSA